MELSFFRRHFLRTFPHIEGKCVLVALSGGADSMALLHLLRLPELSLKIHALHIHHGVRGDDADADAEFCSRQCSSLGISLTILKPEPIRKSGSREADWREMRYREFHRVAHKIGADAVATGHQRDDVAEGVFLQLLRGGSLRSMAGINEEFDSVIRPLLPFSRLQLRAWLRDRGYAWVLDASNESPEHLRNRVRNELLPALERISPRLRDHLLETGAEIAEVEEWKRSELDRFHLLLNPWKPGGIAISSLLEMPRALLGSWLLSLAARWKIGSCTREQIRAFERLLRGEILNLNLPGGWWLRSRGGNLLLEAPKALVYDLPLKQRGGQDLPLPGWHYRIGPGPHEKPASRWSFPVDSLENVRLRSPQPGDRFRDGSKVLRKLKEIHPRSLRWSWPILVNNDKIMWIPGIGVSCRMQAPRWIVEVNNDD